MPIRWLTIFLDFPAQDFGTGVTFWREVTGTELSPPRGPAGEFATLLPAEGDAYLRVQRVREGGGGCHLDLHIDPGTGAAEAARAIALGARARHRGDGLVILDSPGGFTFCLVRSHGEATVPGAVRLDRGGANRADQLSLDIPPDAYDAECAFWAALTGWGLRWGGRPEFAYLERPDQFPVRLLLQRRDSAGERDHIFAHIDFACADRDRLAERHAASGAQILTRFSNWTAMADPTGRRYCLTMRDPATGKLGKPCT